MRPTLITDRPTLYDVFLFATSLTLDKNLEAGVINEGLARWIFRWDGGFGMARILARAPGVSFRVYELHRMRQAPRPRISVLAIIPGTEADQPQQPE